MLAVGLLFSGLNMRWYLQGREQFGAIALIDFVATAVQLAAALLLVNSPDDLVPAAAVMTIGPVVGAILSLGFSFRVGLRSRMVAPTLLLLRVALPLGIASLPPRSTTVPTRFLLGVFRSSAEVGWYSAAYRIVLACLTVPFVTHAVALPILSRLLAEDGPRFETRCPASVGACWLSPFRWQLVQQSWPNLSSQAYSALHCSDRLRRSRS